MTIISRGHAPNPDDQDKELFVENFDLLLSSEQIILTYGDYFFTQLSFAWCSWPYISGDGPLPLGYLLQGWREQIFKEPCSACSAEVLVFAFGGSPLSGAHSWSGFCKVCRTVQSGRESIHKPFSKRISYVQQLRNRFPACAKRWEEYDGVVFSWGGTGLQPARKWRLVWTELANPTSLPDLIAELKSGRKQSIRRKRL
jgi:hypothetical protein